MLFDGVHKLATGAYFGSRLGPWAGVVAAIGIAPGSMAPLFIVLGLVWLIGAALLMARSRAARDVLITISILSLFYVVFGTALSVIALILLSLPARGEP